MCVCVNRSLGTIIQRFSTYLFSSTVFLLLRFSLSLLPFLSLLKLYCMAASSQSRGVVGLGKRFVNQIRAAGSSRDPSHSPSLALRRSVHASVYDKNVEEQVRPTVVPDDVIGPQPDKYWAPHPQTGVFGPSTEHNPAGFHRSSPVNGGEGSVLEQKAFFRPQEGLEKPTEDQL